MSSDSNTVSNALNPSTHLTDIFGGDSNSTTGRIDNFFKDATHSFTHLNDWESGNTWLAQNKKLIDDLNPQSEEIPLAAPTTPQPELGSANMVALKAQLQHEVMQRSNAALLTGGQGTQGFQSASRLFGIGG